MESFGRGKSSVVNDKPTLGRTNKHNRRRKPAINSSIPSTGTSLVAMVGTAISAM